LPLGAAIKRSLPQLPVKNSRAEKIANPK
jgi:hypothetical protein